MFLLQGQISIDGGERLTLWWPVSKKLHDPGHSVILLQLILKTTENEHLYSLAYTEEYQAYIWTLHWS